MIPSTSFLSSNSHYNVGGNGGGGGAVGYPDQHVMDYGDYPPSSVAGVGVGGAGGVVPAGWTDPTSSVTPPPVMDSGTAVGTVTGQGGAAIGVASGSAVVAASVAADPRITSLPRILLMGPRRAGKTSIQRVVFHKMSPHETLLFRLEATQQIERTIVDHTPLCRFTIWDFPGDYYSAAGVSGVGGVASGPGIYGGAGGGMIAGTGASAGEYDYYYGQGAAHMQSHPHYSHQQQQVQPQPQHRPNNEAHGYAGATHGLHGSGGVVNSVGADVPGTSGGAAPNESGGNIGTRPPATESDEDATDRLIYSSATVLIFVMDAQDEPYDHVLQNFIYTVSRAVRVNPSIAVEVFINKVDGELFLSDDAKYDCRRDIMNQVSEDLHDAGLGDAVAVNYHLTSIYDHSIFEALSRVVQKLIPHLQPTLENILNVLVNSCGMEKAYLFDVASKLYISTDSGPVDSQAVELCSDMIDVVLDVSGIYGCPPPGDETGEPEYETHEQQHAMAGVTTSYSDVHVHMADRTPGAPVHEEEVSVTGTAAEQHTIVTSSSTNENNNGAVVSTPATSSAVVAAAVVDGAYSQEMHPDRISLMSEASHSHMGEGAVTGDVGDVGGAIVEDALSSSELEEQEEESAYDEKSESVIRMSNGMVLYLKEVDAMTALVCMTRHENFRKKALINYNISCLKGALKSLVPRGDAAEKEIMNGSSFRLMNPAVQSAAATLPST